MAYDRNFIEHHMMVAQLMEEHHYEEDETVSVDARSVDFNVEYLHMLITEVRNLIGDKENTLGITCSASGLALRSFSTETIEIERDNDDSPIFFKAFGDVYVIVSDDPYGYVYAGFINASGEQHFRRLFFRRY